MDNKYLSLLCETFEEETTDVVIESLKKLNDKNELIDLLNIITVIQETNDEVIHALWDEFNRMSK